MVEASNKDCRTHDRTPLERMFCCRQGVVGAATHELKQQNRSILRTRLVAISVVSLLGHSLSFVRSLLLEYPFTWFQLTPLIILGTSIFLLLKRRDFNHRQLRGLELVIFGTGVAYLAGLHHMAIVMFARQGDVVSTTVAISQIPLSFFALMVMYGMFIPNTWKRAFAVILPMAVTPILLSLYLGLGHPEVSQVIENTRSGERLSFSALILFVGTVFSVWGSHIIHNIRHTAARERELGRYKLQEKIGSGGMGEVWKAKHILLARPAAIKMIRAEVLGAGNGKVMATVKQRFEREAQATASLRSPHTIQLYDFGVTEEGAFYYVMEYLEGVDLEALVKRFGPVPPERTVWILEQATRSLTEAHQRGLIHRDIKPSNLHVGSMGSNNDFVKVLDFGLVKRIHTPADGDTKLTREGSTTGTPAYMAPEMALGHQQVDARSDIYSLGCVAYWMLTGVPVFEGTTPMEVIVNHAKTPPVSPAKRTEFRIPESLERLVLSCLEKDPENRPQSMTEVHQQLAATDVEDPWTEDHALEWWKAHMPKTAKDLPPSLL
jgi:serine/threonine-protein kinase